MNTTFQKEEVKLFIFWQKKYEKMQKYNLNNKQIYRLQENEIIQLIKELQIKELENKIINKQILM